MQSKISSFEQKVYLFSQENDELKRRLGEANELNRRMSEDIKNYESRLRNIQSELEKSKRSHTEFE